MRKVDLFKPNDFSKEWLRELKKTFTSGMIAQAGKVDEFEQKFGEEFNYEYPVALNSGTAALEMAYHLIGIEPGDKVLTPVLTCTATNIPLVHRGADITFVDISTRTMTMDYADFLKKLTPDTKAVVIVNLGGLFTDHRIYQKCQEMNIPVVTDAAQQLGISCFGDYICYSFQAIKHFTTGDGGMICLNNKDEYIRARNLRWFGIDRDRRRKMNFEFSPSDREMCMNMDEPGFKTHMNDIMATMGLVGIQHSYEALTHRRKIASTYIKKLEKYNIDYVCGGSYWLFAILVSGRDKLMDDLKKKGIGSDLVHLRNDIFTPFGGKRLPLDNMDYIENRYLYIPIHSKMSIADAKYVANAVTSLVLCPEYR